MKETLKYQLPQYAIQITGYVHSNDYLNTEIIIKEKLSDCIEKIVKEFNQLAENKDLNSHEIAKKQLKLLEENKLNCSFSSIMDFDSSCGPLELEIFKISKDGIFKLS